MDGIGRSRSAVVETTLRDADVQLHIPKIELNLAIIRRHTADAPYDHVTIDGENQLPIPLGGVSPVQTKFGHHHIGLGVEGNHTGAIQVGNAVVLSQEAKPLLACERGQRLLAAPAPHYSGV